VDIKLFYTKHFCWCKRDENGDKVWGASVNPAQIFQCFH
jgi:hypothetical protein